MFPEFVFVIVLLSCESYEHAVNTTNATRRYWSYDNEDSWPGMKCKYGSLQSPIDIQDENVIVDWDEVFIKGQLQLRGYTAVLMTAINNGITVQLSTDGEPSMHPELLGGPLRYSYRLEQVHFHWLSEHSINGRKYPMEIHFVHVRDGLSVPEALKTKEGLAIIAIMCHVKSWLLESDDDPLAEVMDTLPELQTRGHRHSGVVLNLTRILSASEREFVAYSGSLTSPECNEVVTWIIFRKPVPMSAQQHKKFMEINRKKNYRELQTLRSHKLYSIRPNSIFEKPALLVAFDGMVNKMKGFFKDVKSVFKNMYPK